MDHSTYAAQLFCEGYNCAQAVMVAFSDVTGLDPAFAAAIGFTALFCGVVNCPLASIILALEVFGAEGILYFAIACSVSYMLSGKFGLYHSQRIVYSKLDDEEIK